MIKRNSIISVLILLQVCGCCRKSSIPEQVAEKISTDLNKNGLYEAALLTPQAGCPGCISNAELFTKQYVGRENILFIFTRIHSEKELRIKLEIEKEEFNNIFFDKTNIYSFPEDYAFKEYPHIIYFTGEKSFSIKPVMPGSGNQYDSLLYSTDKLTPVVFKPEDVIKQEYYPSSISLIAENIEYIRLQTSNDFMIAEILDFRVSDSMVFIIDSNENAFAFNMAGSFITKYGTKGNGPGEYLSLLPGSLFPDTINKEVIICDYSGRKILIYSFSGELKRVMKLNFRATSVSLINDSTFCFLADQATFKMGEPGCLIITNRGGNIIHRFNCKITRKNFISPGNFIIDGKEIYFTETSVSDTIFKLVDKYRVKTAIVIDKADLNPPDEVLNDIGKWPEHISDYIYNISLQISKGVIFYFFSYNKISYSGYLIPDRNVMKVLFKGSVKKGISDDIDFGPQIKPFLQIRDGVILDVINPNELSGEEYRSVRPGSRLAKLREDLNPEDNPVIRMIKIKDL